MLTFDWESLTRRLDAVSPRSRTVFALLCSERLLPMYEAFSAKSPRGRWSFLRAESDNLWDQLSQGVVHPDHEFLAEYPSLAPNDDWPTSEFTLLQPLAENAVLALGSAWECHVSGATEKAMWAADQAYQAMDFMAQHLKGIDYRRPGGEEALHQSDIVQDELKRQLHNLATLEQISESDANYVALL